MFNNGYDESLVENPFFKIIKQNYNYILEQAPAEQWIICIPRSGSISLHLINKEMILEHVLVSLTDRTFVSLRNKEISIKDDRLVVKEINNEVQMLFEETFYFDKNCKYKLWCLERPLDSKNQLNSSQTESLWFKDNCVVQNINVIIAHFLQDNFEYDSMSSLRQKFSDLYANCVEEFKQDHNVSELKLYIQQRIHEKLFRAINNSTSKSDAEFNKTIRNLSQIQLKHLQVDKRFYNDITHAKYEIGNFNRCLDVTSRIDCLRRIVYTISDFRSECNKNQLSKLFATSDDLINIFVFLIIKSGLNNWIANLMYVLYFRFDLFSLFNDEDSFLVTTLEAAIKFVQNQMPTDKISFFVDDIENFKLYEAIEEGNLDVIESVFIGGQNTESLEEDRCHPLCSCDKCECLEPFSVNTRDCKGRTFLHFACLFGKLNVAQYFIVNGIHVGVSDNSEATCLHYSASRGHHGCLMYLLNLNVNPKAIDHDGNTPLHLAVNNGHEECVKVLMCYFEQLENEALIRIVNLQNNIGNTPTHLAAKWGYLELVYILLEHGARTDLRNKRNQSPLDLAHNDYIKKLLQKVSNVKVADDHNNKRLRAKQSKRTNLLLKSIENDDLPLTCYYLGIPIVQNGLIAPTPTCHPLCTCEKCLKGHPTNKLNLSASDKKLNIDSCNVNGYSALHVASKLGRLDIVKLLLNYGASCNLKTYKESYTPLHLACIKGHAEVVGELLKCRECNTNIQDAVGSLPLHYACMNGHNHIVNLLKT